MNDFMEKYLGEVDRRLRRLPVAERVDIVNELKARSLSSPRPGCRAGRSRRGWAARAPSPPGTWATR